MPRHGSMLAIVTGWVLAMLRGSRVHINISKAGRALGFGASWLLELLPFARRILDPKGICAMRASRVP